MAVMGIVLGASAAWLLGHAAQSLLFGVEAGSRSHWRRPPRCSRLSRSARPTFRPGAPSRVDPMTVLRYE